MDFSPDLWRQKILLPLCIDEISTCTKKVTKEKKLAKIMIEGGPVPL
jgi:hypothetical protein